MKKPLRLVFLCVLLFSALILLTTCELQINKSTRKSVALQIVVPRHISGGGKGLSSRGISAKDLAGGTNVIVTITTISPPGGATVTSSPIPTDGNPSVTYTSPSLAAGSYQASAQLLDDFQDLLSQVTSASFTVPTQTNPVVLTMPSNLLSAAITNYSGIIYQLTPLFIPTTYDYTDATDCTGPFSLALTTVDADATITVIETDFTYPPVTLLNAVPSPNSCLLNLNNSPATITIVVTAPDGTTQTYTTTITFGGC